jgi:hypothetical protein
VIFRDEQEERRRRRLLLTVLGGGGLTPAQLAGNYIATLSPVLWLRLQETSGNPVNSGSATLTVVKTALTQGVTGKLGANEAATWDGLTSLITITAAAPILSPTSFEWVFLANPVSAGEGNTGIYFRYGFDVQAAYPQSGGTTLNFFVDYSTTDALYSIAIPTLNAGYRTFFFSHDGATKQSIIKVATGGTLSAPAPIANTTGVGTFNPPTANLIIGNNSIASATFDGSMDEVILFNRILTDGERTALAGFFQ